ncbi:MAG: TolC family protein [Dysgonomonas sp.]
MIKKYIIAIGVFISCSMAQAQPAWTLRECITYAIENNTAIKQQKVSVDNAEINLNTSKSSRLPDLNASLGHEFTFGRTTYSATNGVGKSNSGTSNFSISSSTPLFTGFKITNDIEAKKFDLMAATEGLKKAKDDLGLQVTSYYLDVLFKKEILKVYKEQVDLTKLQVEKTSVMVETGKVAKSQLYDINSQLANDELNMTNAKNDLDLSLLNLIQSLNLQKDISSFDIASPAVDDVVSANFSSLMTPSEVYSTAIQIRPQVKEAEYTIESSKKTLKVAQSGYYPQLNLTMGYGTSSQRIYNESNASLRDQLDQNGAYNIGFSLSIPIFNRFQVRNQVRSAKLSILNNELALDNVKQALFKEIQQAYQSAVGAQAKYIATEKSLAATSESFKYVQERYNVGKANVYEYSESQTKLLSSKSERLQAKYDFLFRTKILDFYAGKEINLE